MNPYRLLSSLLSKDDTVEQADLFSFGKVNNIKLRQIIFY